MDALFVAINAKYVHTNIAVRYLSRYCQSNNIESDFCEFTINEPQGRILEKLYMQNTCVYGFSCYIWNIERVLETCQNLKKLKPECRIFLGGPEVSFDGEELLSKYDFIDYIICGEGEVAMLQLLKNLPEERCVIYGEKLCSIEELPFPYADEDLKSVVDGEKLVYYESSRGCPFCCAYCLSAADEGVRFVSVDRVKKDLKRFVDAGVQTVKFVDRTFNADKKRAVQIWEYILSLDCETCFHFEIGADLLSEEAVEVLKKAPLGRFQFEIGVQSTNPQTISEISRKMDFGVLSERVRTLREQTKVMLHLDLIAGLPFEDFESFKKSFNDVYCLSPHVLQLGFLKLLKGSPLRENCEKYKMLHKVNASYEIFSTKWLGYEEMIKLKAVEDVLERYFNSGRFYETLDAAIKFFDTPFEFYYRLSRFWDERDLVGQGVKRITLYQLLYEFLGNELNDEECENVVSVMRKDFSKWHSNGIGTPDWYKNKKD